MDVSVTGEGVLVPAVRHKIKPAVRVVLAVYLKALACNVKRMVRALLPKPGVLSPATR